MKTNKFVIVTGSCMFLLLMMIIFNVGGGTKTTYSAESTGYCYKCYNSAGTIVQQQWSATNMDGAVVGVACGPTNNGGTWRAGTSSTEASCPNHTASESDNPGSTTKGCDNGTPEADGDGCASCNNGYKLQTNLNADGTSYNICVEDSSVSTGYCYKCYNSAGTIVQQTWSATNMDSAVVGVACGPTNNRGTWRAGTSSTEASCPNQTASSKITPSISVSGSKTSGTQGTTGTLSVTVTNASSCPGTISVRNTYGMKVEGSVTFTTKSIDTNGPHTFSYSATGEGGTTGNLLVSYVPNDLTKCSQPNNASFNFKINISDTDNRTKSTLTISNKSNVSGMAKGDSEYLYIGANTTGKLNVSVGDSKIVSFTFDEGNNNIESEGAVERATVKALAIGSTTISIEFVPTDTSKYTNASASIPVTVVESEGYSCYSCTYANGTANREWAQSILDLGSCDNGWQTLKVDYNQCTDIQGKCYRCNHNGSYKWTVDNLSGAANVDNTCLSGWAFIKYTDDASSCNAAGDPTGGSGDGGYGDGGYGDNTGNPDDNLGDDPGINDENPPGGSYPGGSNPGGTNPGGTTPGGSNPGGSNNNTNNNPQTGSITIFLVWIIGLTIVGYSFWYFKNLSKNGA